MQLQQSPLYDYTEELEDFVGAKFYCLHALADSNQHWD